MSGELPTNTRSISSTRNVRIERLWVDVGEQFGRSWRAFFLRLERLHGLDAKDPAHLWLIHGLFLDEIDQDCLQFKDDWNHHPISTEKNQTPNDIWFTASLENGVYDGSTDQNSRRGDPLTHANVGEHDLQTSYGAEEERPEGAAASASHTSYSGAWDDIGLEMHGGEDWRGMRARQIARDLRGNIRHSPIRVPRHVNPFLGDLAREERFWEKVQALKDARPEMIPEGYNLLDEDFEEEMYPSAHEIPLGRSKTRTQVIPLPYEVWYPRAVRWVQALHVLNHELSVFA
ncbi:hypothetical protein PENSPDRAFT_710703 [Peniophora sp. CONT]|nr:hypothetical protein PENSPDRAFT_710703 [Peniophora sp. CONT]